MKKTACIVLSLLISGLVFSLPTVAGSQLVSLGTGGITGVYYPAGGAICRLVNSTRQQHGIRCAVQSSPGSVANIKRVRNGELDMGLAESGWIYHAWNGSDLFIDQGPDRKLRTLLKLFPEYLTVLAHPDAGVEQFVDIRNKRINIGKPGTSQRSTLSSLMRGSGWSLSDFAVALSLEPAEQASALCDRRIDVMIYTVGHPSGATKEATRDCGSKLIPVTGGVAKSLMADNPQYLPITLAGGFYSANPEDVTTLGVSATFFTDDDLPEDTAYAVVKSLFEQFDRFQAMHPAFAELDPQQMVAGPYPAPLHPGAERYFREAGLLP